MGFDDGVFLTRDRARPGGADGGLLLGLARQQVENDVAHLRSVTEDPVEFVDVGPVDGEDAVVGVEGHDHDVGALHERREQIPFACPSRDQALQLVVRAPHERSGLHDVFDVRVGAVPAGRPAPTVPLRLAAREHPSIAAGGAAEAVFALEGLARRQSAGSQTARAASRSSG